MGIRSRRNLARTASRNIAVVTKALAPTTRKKGTQRKNTERTKLPAEQSDKVSAKKQSEKVVSKKQSEKVLVKKQSENDDVKVELVNVTTNSIRPEESASPKSFKCAKCNAEFLLRIKLALHVKQEHKKFSRSTLKKSKKPNVSKVKKSESSAVNNADTDEVVVKEEPPEEEIESESSQQCNSSNATVQVQEAVPSAVVECFMMNENPENQQTAPDFADIFTVVEVKEEDIEQFEASPEYALEEDKVKLEKSSEDALYKCKFCARTFRHKKNIRPHVNKKHPDEVIVMVPDTSNYYDCEFCNRKFKYKKNLNAHTRLKHPEVVVKSVDDVERPFQCTLCDRKLKYKRNLNAHIRTKHLMLFQGDFTCNSCDRRFLFRKNLLVHLRNKHPSEIDQTPLHVCGVCSETFRTVSALRKHKSSLHPQQTPLPIFPKKCPLCDFFTSQKLPILRHFADTHDIEVKTINVEFEDMQSFYDWKEDIEKETNCKYTKISTGKFEDHTTMIFQCHRSGRSRKNRSANGAVVKPSMSLKSLKMNAYCPAQLYVVDYYTEIKVRYTSTHVGHENDVLIRRPEPRNRLMLRTIENMIQEEISQYPQVVPQEEAPYKERKQILLRVGSKSKIDEKTRNFEMKTIEDWVNVHDADVLFYRKSGDTTFLDLIDGELILIIMNKEQQVMMRKYGKKFICVHTIHDSLKYAFTWTTIMVLDNNKEGFPVAFLVSNKTSAEIYQIFFQCVVNAVGSVVPDVFMGDKNEEMYFAWSEVVQPAEQFLFCPWQVREDWQNNAAAKIKDEVKRRSVLNLLESILIEAKHDVFEDQLNSFIERSDEDVLQYRDYFIENYMETIPAWAYCYRHDPNVEGNLTLEIFKKIFTPSNSAESGDFISVTEALLTLDEYHASKRITKDIPAVKIVGLDGLISIIEDNHKRALNVGLEMDSVLETEEGWLVKSSPSSKEDDVQQTYKIQRNETIPCVNCKLVCPTCDVCFHKYSCSCMDSKNKLSMCDHIHFVGNMLRNASKTD